MGVSPADLVVACEGSGAGIEDARLMHCAASHRRTSMKSADGVPLEMVLTLGCYGCEGGEEVKEMMGEPFTFQIVALVDVMGHYQVFRPKAEDGFNDLRFRQRRVLIELRRDVYKPSA